MNPDNNGVSDPKSFSLYTGKAPIIIQILAGLLWLGAAGLILQGLLSLVLSPVAGVAYLVVAVLFVMTAKGMFKMKKASFKNGIILGIVILVASIVNIIINHDTSYTNFIYPIVLLIVLFSYRNRFVN